MTLPLENIPRSDDEKLFSYVVLLVTGESVLEETMGDGIYLLTIFFFYFNISRSTKINYGLSIGL